MNDTTADYVIVGAGSAGCVLAARLSEQPDVRVLVLEAGTTKRPLTTRVPALGYRARGTAMDWTYLTTPQAGLSGRPMHWTRGRGLGGTSLVNAQVWLRAHPSDFDTWPAGDVGWRWPDVERFYARAENDTRPGGAGGRGGPVHIASLRHANPMTEAFLEGAHELGLRANPDLLSDLDGAGRMPVTQRAGARWSAAEAYLAPARARSNVQVVTDATTTRILFDGTRAIGVEYLRAGVRHRARVDAEVLVCAGTIASPQLLMLSGVGPPDQLRTHNVDVVASLPGTGGNLRDHVGLATRFRTRGRHSLVAAESPWNVARYAVGRRGRLTSNVIEAGLFRGAGTDAPPDLELAFAPVLHSPDRLFAGARWWATRRLRPHHGCSIFANVQPTRSVGSVELAATDPLAPPRIEPGCLTDPDGADLAALVDAVRTARAVADTNAMARWVTDEMTPGADVRREEDLVSFVRRTCGTTEHAVGTCRMGSDDLAVVDDSLRVHGTTGLRVVDASVIPTVPTGHPYATVVMLGERAADLVSAGR